MYKLSFTIICLPQGWSLILQDLIFGFDQEAAAVVMARLISFKMESEVKKHTLDNFAISLLPLKN